VTSVDRALQYHQRSECFRPGGWISAYGEGGRGAVAVFTVAVAIKMVWLRTLEGAVLFDPG
jgi:hypothetical protein